MDNKEIPRQNNHTTSAYFMVKRKRGRPRKHHKPDDSNNHSPPGFSRSQHQSLQIDAMVGQHVTGVIEAAFDDGFLLSVKVGDSDTMLRGVVFKPGHFHPVSTDNDVAPHVPMIRRDNHLVDLHGSEAQGGRKSSLHEKNVGLEHWFRSTTVICRPRPSLK
ncbi:unnamed protein product [Eruca vesicaria subsp. sativa]|uniref:Uncharacterized protein n=1 Tax=Eruca vesicaria subsp. sativa TaxID=29727 RepID=A0ABC8KXS6_ERUVS|nr:unnamed protein product [Eruca vesicaria subsp. sativa]